MAQQNERKQADKQICADLWEKLNGNVAVKFNPHIVRHQKYTFLGYVRLDIDLSAFVPGFKIHLPNIEVKELSGGPYLGLPNELNEGTGKRYTDYRFGSNELRQVLTTIVFADAEVAAASKKAAEMPAPAAKGEEKQAEASSANPFVKKA